MRRVWMLVVLMLAGCAAAEPLETAAPNDAGLSCSACWDTCRSDGDKTLAEVVHCSDRCTEWCNREGGTW